MDDRLYRLFSSIIALVFGVSVLVVFGKPVYNYIKETEERAEVEESAYAGEIINKEIENARHGFFTSSDSEYRIYIEFEYTYNDEKKTGEKYFTVDKETYLAYDIGDWFDSHNFKKWFFLFQRSKSCH